MSEGVKMFSRGKKVTMKIRQQDRPQTLLEGEDLLLNTEEYLRRQIDQELQFAQKNRLKNKRVALQTLRRKKRYEKQLKLVTCAMKAVQFVSDYIRVTASKVNNPIKDTTEKPDVAQDTSAHFGVDPDEAELLPQLERLTLEESLQKAPSVQVLAAVSPSTERPPSSQAEAESDSSGLSPNPPAIFVTAPSRENIYGSPSTLTIADAVKERRPSSMPFIVGKKAMASQ